MGVPRLAAAQCGYYYDGLRTLLGESFAASGGAVACVIRCAAHHVTVSGASRVKGLPLESTYALAQYCKHVSLLCIGWMWRGCIRPQVCQTSLAEFSCTVASAVHWHGMCLKNVAVAVERIAAYASKPTAASRCPLSSTGQATGRQLILPYWLLLLLLLPCTAEFFLHLLGWVDTAGKYGLEGRKVSCLSQKSKF